VADPTRVRLLLAKELSRLRDLAGISGREMARRTGVSQPTMSRIGHGVAVPSVPVAQQWLDECAADADTRERVLALVEAALGETRAWRDLLDEQEHLQDVARERNAAARLVRNFQPTVIPGLLQTAEYARRILAMGRTDSPAALAARLDRQQVLHEPGRRFEFLLAEQLLHWSPGPGALTGQMDRLASLATLEQVALAIVPADAAVGVAWHNFVIREPADGGPVYVTTELVHGAQEISDPESVGIYVALWERLWKASVVDEDAVALIRGAGR
jgi:transcriptional regulator with XRE-family HTH domain